MPGWLIAYLSPGWEDWTFESSWAFRETPEGILALAWESNLYRHIGRKPIINLLFIDCMSGEIQHHDSYQWDGFSADNLQIWSGDKRNGWIVTWEGFPTEQTPLSILSCFVHWSIPMSSSLPVVIDQAENNMTRMGPVLYATEMSQEAVLIHLQPSVDDTASSLVRVNQGLKESYTAFTLEDSSEVEVALKASVCFQKNSWYMIIFNAERNNTEDYVVEVPSDKETLENSFFELSHFFKKPEVKSESIRRNVFKGKPYWRFWIAGGNSPITEPVWKYQLGMRIPATLFPFSDFDEDVLVGSIIISGPCWEREQQEQQTVVVAVGIIKKEAIGLPEDQARPLRGGELICLSQDGQVVQECKEEIVEQVELCLVGNIVIGVDRIQRRWRLWQWEPLAGKEQFTTVQWLDESVVHAHVVTNHENSDPQGTQFWLVEERPKGLIVSRRSGLSLEETETPVTLTGWSLPYALERSVGEWDWPVKKGLIGHEDALLLIAADEENRMVLYRVEADKQ